MWINLAHCILLEFTEAARLPHPARCPYDARYQAHLARCRDADNWRNRRPDVKARRQAYGRTPERLAAARVFVARRRAVVSADPELAAKRRAYSTEWSRRERAKRTADPAWVEAQRAAARDRWRKRRDRGEK